MPEPTETSQDNPWLEFFKRVRRLAAQLDALDPSAQPADAEEDRESARS